MPKTAWKTITDARWSIICDWIGLGYSKIAGCKAAGISVSTFYRYLRFAAAERSAWLLIEDDSIEPNGHVRRLLQLEAAEAKDIKQLEDKVKVTASGAQWLLEHRYADIYGDLALQIKDEHLEAFAQMLEMIKEGKLRFDEVASRVDDTLATRLFRIAGVPVDEPGLST